MKAAVLRDPYGVENLNVEKLEDPVPSSDEISVKIKMATLNPIDLAVINNRVPYRINPVPHIPGSEAFGIAENDGKFIRKGDRVAIYHRIFDGTCDNCLQGMENICPNGGIFGVASNGGFAEKVSVNEKYLMKTGNDASDEVAASLTVSGLTAYHALQRAMARGGQKILVYGASGNTGIFAVQIAKSFGLEIHAVSGKDWVSDYGADFVYGADSIPEELKADVVINSLGTEFWESSLKHVATGGTLVTYGAQTGAPGSVNIPALYARELNIRGSTGGTRNELRELIRLAAAHGYRVPVHRKFPLENIKDAIAEFGNKRNGKILIEM